LLLLNKLVDPRAAFPEVSKSQTQLEKDLNNFYSTLKLDPTYGFIIARLVAGDVMILESQKKKLSWLFPFDPQNPLIGVNALGPRQLLMSLCSLCNINVRVEQPNKTFPGNSRAASDFVTKMQEFKKKDSHFFVEQIGSNAISYSMATLYDLTGVNPLLVQAFVLDKHFYLKDLTRLHTHMTKEFLLLVVLNFANLPDHLRGALGCEEYVDSTVNYMDQVSGMQQVKFNKGNLKTKGADLKKKVHFYKDLYEAFQTKKLGDLAKAYMSTDVIKQFISDDDSAVQDEINKSFTFLAMECYIDPNDKVKRKQFLKEVMDDQEKTVKNKKKYKFEDLFAIAKKYKAPADNGEEPQTTDKDEEIAEFLVQILTKTHELLATHAFSKVIPFPDTYSKHESADFVLTNFSMMGSLFIVRFGLAQKFEYARIIFNIDNILLNIQRKTATQHVLTLFPKYAFIKLIGISAGFKMSNIVEWSPEIPQPIFDLDTVSTINKAPTPPEKDLVKVNYLYEQFWPGQGFDPKEYSPDIWCGPFVMKWSSSSGSATLQLTKDDLMDEQTWDGLNLKTGVNETFFGNNDSNNFFSAASDYVPKIMWDALRGCKGKQSEPIRDKYGANINYNVIYYTRTIIEQENAQGATSTTVDLITGKLIKDVKQEMLEFEINLFHPQMNMLIGILIMDYDRLSDNQNFIGKQLDDVVDIYTSIMTLHTFSRFPDLELSWISDCLATFAPKLDSEPDKTDEILTFLFDSTEPSLEQCFESLGEEKLPDLLFIWYSYENPEIDDEDIEDPEVVNLDEPKQLKSPSQLPWDNLGLSTSEIDLLNLVIDTYNLYSPGWMKLIKGLQKQPDELATPYQKAAIRKFANISKYIKFLRKLPDASAISDDKNGNKPTLYSLLIYMKKDKDTFKIDDSKKLWWFLQNVALLPDEKGIADTPTNALFAEPPALLLDTLTALINKDSQTLTYCLFPFDQIPVNEDGHSSGQIGGMGNQEVNLQPLIEKGEKDFKAMLKYFPIDGKVETDKNKLAAIEEDTNKSLRLFKVFSALVDQNYQYSLDLGIRKPIIKQIVSDFNTYYLQQIPAIGSVSDDKKRKKIAKLLFGLFNWDVDLLLAGLAREETAELYYLFASLHGIANMRGLHSDYENLGKYSHFCVKNIMAFSAKSLKFEEVVDSKAGDPNSPTKKDKDKDKDKDKGTISTTKAADHPKKDKSISGASKSETKADPKKRYDDHVKNIEEKFRNKQAKLKKWRKLLFLYLQDPVVQFTWTPQIREMFDPKTQDIYKLPKAEKGKPEHITQGFMTGQIISVLWDAINKKLADSKSSAREYNITSITGKKHSNQQAGQSQSQSGGVPGVSSNIQSPTDTSGSAKALQTFNFFKTFLDFACNTSEKVYSLGLSTQTNRKIKKTNMNRSEHIPEKLDADLKACKDSRDANVKRRFPLTPPDGKTYANSIPDLDPFFKLFQDSKSKDLVEIKPVIPVLQALMKFYSTLSANEHFKSPDILWQALMKIMEFADNFLKNCSKEEAKFIKTILSLLIGTDFNSEPRKVGKEQIPRYARVTATDAGSYFFDNVIMVAFRQLSPKKFNMDKVKVMLNIVGLIQKDFLNNTKNPGRLEEIIETVLNSISSLIPGFNQEVATAISDLAFGKLDGLKSLIMHHLTAEGDTLAAAGGSPVKVGSSQSIEEGPSGKLPNKSIQVKGQSDVGTEAEEAQKAADSLKNNPFAEKASKVYGYLGNLQGMLDFSSLKAKLPTGGASGGLSNQVDPETWNGILKKIQSGDVKPADIFQILNRYGGGKGSINPTSFKLLAGRLGIQLSDHRINEIFAKVKGGKVPNPSQMTLNVKEFEKAMIYLMEKSLHLAMDSLGISSEQLGVLLMFLVIMLILVFIFIFVGIGAFALGGTFGSVVNSMFPAIGGGSLGKESDSDKNKLNPEAIATACKQAVDIIKSAVHGGGSS
jgi:hypothetical protein